MSTARELLERDLVAPLLSPWLVPRDVMRLSETSRACSREVRAGLQELDMVDKYGMTNQHVITIVRCFPSLRSLKLNHCEDVTDKGISAIARLSMLRELDIGGCDVSDAGLSVLSEKLESLCLGDFSYGAPKERLLSDATLIAAVRRCPRLLSLDLQCVSEVTDASIAVIAEACPLLKSIDLTMTDNFTDAAIVSLATCRWLETVILDTCEHITTIVPMAENCPLKKLDLTCKRLKEASIFALAEKCPLTLKELVLCPTSEGVTNQSEENYTSDSFKALARCRSLEKLDAASCRYVTDASAVAVVSSCVGLLVLDLGDCRVTDVSVMAIAHSCPMLQEISLGGPGYDDISDESIVALASRCRRLREVTLASSYITDVSFKALARYASCLQSLYVRCPITDAGLIPIGRQCPQLHTVSFKSPLITDDGIAALSGLIDLAMHDNGAVTAFAIAQLVVRSPGLVWLSTYNCPGWRDRGGKGHELARLLHEHLPNPARSHPRIMQFLPSLTLHS